MSIRAAASAGIASIPVPPVSDLLSSDATLSSWQTHLLDMVQCLRSWALELPFLLVEGICTQISGITSCRLWEKATACLPCILTSAQKAPTFITAPLLNSLHILAAEGPLEEARFADYSLYSLKLGSGHNQSTH